ncbi:MAG: protein-L-isoaspartate O-methyltransferase [Betaproteobacteria bacterium]|nr:protein-L-isoaspartate O-methyltransferase [Betaproteobacteria bacterium]
MNTELARFNMVEQQIRTWSVLDKRVLDLLARLDRHLFVPATFASLAYSDTEIPLPDGEHMLAPRVVARLLQDLQLQPHERVLEVGTGSGYLTALLSQSCAQVLSLECHPGLLASAQQHLSQAGVRNALLRHSMGVPEAQPEGPFDAVILSGSVATVPHAMLDLLKPDGRLLAVVGDLPMMHATRVTRQKNGQGHSQILWDVVTPRLHGFAETPAFHF